MTKSQVIKPEEVVAAWKLALPDEVVDAFNAELVAKFDGKYARVLQETLLKTLQEKGFESSRVREQGWLKQVYDMYVESGWKVQFKSPGSDESFKSYYFFEYK